MPPVVLSVELDNGPKSMIPPAAFAPAKNPPSAFAVTTNPEAALSSGDGSGITIGEGPGAATPSLTKLLTKSLLVPATSMPGGGSKDATAGSSADTENAASVFPKILEIQEQRSPDFDEFLNRPEVPWQVSRNSSPDLVAVHGSLQIQFELYSSPV